MTIADCHPGSLLAIAEDGDVTCVELGALTGALKVGRRTTPPTHALVRSVDPHTHELVAWSDRFVHASLEVVDVIQTPVQRKALRTINARTARTPEDGGAEVDPVSSQRQRGETF